MFPEVLKSLSDEQLVAHIQRYVLAILNKAGNELECSFHPCRG